MNNFADYFTYTCSCIPPKVICKYIYAVVQLTQSQAAYQTYGQGFPSSLFGLALWLPQTQNGLSNRAFNTSPSSGTTAAKGAYCNQLL